jgi:hypothetical protein
LAFRRCENRIQVDLADFRNRFDEMRNTQQHLFVSPLNRRPAGRGFHLQQRDLSPTIDRY